MTAFFKRSGISLDDALIDLYALKVLMISPSLDSNCVTKFGLYFARSGIGFSEAKNMLSAIFPARNIAIIITPRVINKSEKEKSLFFFFLRFAAILFAFYFYDLIIIY